MKSAGVIIVSPDPDTQDLYIYGLRAERRPAYGTSGLEDTLALAAVVRPAAIVVDVRAVGDWELCRNFRREPLTREVPLVVITGYIAPSGQYRHLAGEIGCAAFLAKPSLPDTLDQVIRRVVRGERGIEVMTAADVSV
jgi:CheY-like chemotaxis protein